MKHRSTRLRRCSNRNRIRIIFNTELDAKIVLAKRIHADKGEVRTYRCGKHYHLTSMTLEEYIDSKESS